jgi:Flp pilus assembly protein TadD
MDDTKKRWIWIALLALGLVGAGLAGWYLGLPAYRNWKQEKFLSQARGFMAKSDYRNASLSAQKVLLAGPSNLEATRIMAEITDKIGAPQAVQWHQRLVELQPGVLQNRLDLAKAAFVQNDLARAQKALQGVDESGRKSPAYHEMASLIAAAAQQLDLSEKHMAEAARLDPENKRLQLNLAVIHLQARNQEVVQEARKNLEKLTTDEKFHRDALRILAMAAIRTNDLKGALTQTTRLVADPRATPEDRILHLSTLATNQSAELQSYLTSLEREWEKKPEQVFVLAGWMAEHGRADEALKWLEGLEAETKRAWPVTMAKVNLLMARKDWAGLDVFLQERKWNEVEFARQAFLARLASERKESLARQAAWRTAVREASDRAKALTGLVQMAHSWGWIAEKDDLLWLIFQRFPRERWALQELERGYYQAGNTHGLNKVYSAMVDYDAKDVGAKNNLTATALLLKINLGQAFRTAKEVYDLRPKDPIAASTYAYALHLQGKTGQGLKVMEALAPGQLENPGVAVCYGVILCASGETNKARKYLDLALAGRLLPEEKALVLEARKSL